MTKLKNVQLRGKIYHFRMNIPKELQAHYTKTTHTQSLETSDALEASKKADVLTDKYKKEHRALRESMKMGTSVATPQPKQTNGPSFDLSFFEHELRNLSGDLSGLRKGALEKLYFKFGSAASAFQYASDSELSVKDLDKDYLLPLSRETILELCMRAVGVDDLSDGSLRRKTARLVIPKAKAILEDLVDEIAPMIGKSVVHTEPQLINGQWLDVPVSKPSVPIVDSGKSNSSADSERGKILFSEVYQRCLKAKPRGKGTMDRMRSSAQLLMDWYGDKPINYYTKDRMRAFVSDCLMKVPPNMQKVKPWKSMTLKQIVKKTIPEDVIEPDTMHNKLADLTTVFTFAVDDDYIVKHPTSKLSAMLPDRAEDADRSYCKDTLERILELLTYDPKKPSRYWAVLIGLFTGARRGEICQLHTNDVVKIDGVDCICINDEDAETTFKRVKNKPSKRTVPVHPSLRKSGFLEYVKMRTAEVRGDAELLFPELTYSETDGYGRQVGDWFARFRREFKPTNKNERGFHSLRHTFIMWAQNEAEMADREILELTGHETPTISKVHKQYAHALKPDRLYRELIKLDYGLTIPKSPFHQHQLTRPLATSPAQEV